MKKKILLITNSSGRWIQQDAEILGIAHTVKTHQTNVFFNFKAGRCLLESDIIFLWFLSLKHFPIFLLSKLLNKRIISNIGGFEIENISELNYGGFRPGWAKLVREWMVKNSSSVITVSNYLSEHISSRTGVENHVIPLAFEAPRLDIKRTQDRTIDFVMVSNIDDQTFLLKGFDYYLKMAQSMPTKEFALVGRYTLYKISIDLPPNLKIFGYIDHDDPIFWSILNNSRFIVQPSRTEGFGSAVIEGAIQGAIPIVNNKGALPEVVKDYGVIWNFETMTEYVVPNDKVFINTEISAQLTQIYSKENRASKMGALLKNLTT